MRGNFNILHQFTMANVPCSIVVFSEDQVNFPISWVNVVLKHSFQYGVKSMDVKSDRVHLNLTYCPRAATLKRKLGNLPLRYIRTKLDNEAEFKIMQKIVQRYGVNMIGEEDEAAEASTSSSSSGTPSKKLFNGKRMILPPLTIENNEEEEEEEV